MRPEIRKITSSTLAKNFGQELKFVTEENGHLWIFQHGKPRAVVIPIKDEAVLHELQGRSFKEILHKANIEHARTIRAAWRARMYQSELVENQDFAIPPKDFTDAEWEEFKRVAMNEKRDFITTGA